MRELAVAMKWRTQRVKRMLQKIDGAFRLGTHWYTTPELLRQAMPKAWNEVWVRIMRQREVK